MGESYRRLALTDAIRLDMDGAGWHRRWGERGDCRWIKGAVQGGRCMGGVAGRAVIGDLWARLHVPHIQMNAVCSFLIHRRKYLSNIVIY